jgi:hypothetical protein
MALGARVSVAIPGALTFRDQRDVARFSLVLEQIGAGTIRRVAFAVPSRDSWSLPGVRAGAALGPARGQAQRPGRARRRDSRTEPLAVFGTEASRLVAELMAERGIRFVGSSIPRSVSGDGSLALQFDAPTASWPCRNCGASYHRGPGELAGLRSH